MNVAGTTEAPVRMIAGNAPLYDIQKNVIDTLEGQKKALDASLEEIKRKISQQKLDLEIKQEESRNRQKKIIALDVADFLLAYKGWQVGRPMEYQGKVFAFVPEGIKVSKDWDDYTPPSIAGEYVSSHRRGSWYIYASLGTHGGSYTAAHLKVWQDDLSVYYEDFTDCKHSDLPVGSHYPSRLQIGNALRGSGARIEDSGFRIDWTWARRISGKKWNDASQSSLVKSMTYICHDLNSLKAMAFHQNRCTKLQKSFTTRGYLDSYEYQEIRDDNENLTKLAGVFQFKMIAKGENDEQPEE